MKVFVTLSVIVCFWAIAYGQQAQQSIACSVPGNQMETFFSCVRSDQRISTFLDQWDTCKNNFFPTATDGQVLQQMCGNMMVKAANQFYNEIKTVAETCQKTL
ncbi:uncharacterized protein LOC106471378 isoform X2 [Limulus polyphemus]|uniref:Uncharacterized protein LOC106471378 isoform X2 n=1 Tax=Limulus polyphemus TaxID=6850 RepID=A0ABM1TII0_LIMPO|nr:uncharacterized protein LOC106471378 isoform X2 [Limulus polyphemus]